MPSREALRAAYAHCDRETRRHARSFWAAIRLLPPGPRLGMASLYAFCRLADDIADGPGSPEDRSARLAELRRAMDQGLWGLRGDPVATALSDAVKRFGIRPEDLSAVVDGVAMDCRPARYATFDELRGYCDRVASAVGRASVAVLGNPGGEALRKAAALGIAMQLTNILRDLREDARTGRCYLPEEELGRFGVSGADLGRSRASPALRRLVAFQVARARGFFREADGLEAMLPRATRFFPAALAAVYGRILSRIAASGHDPLAEPAGGRGLEAAVLTAGVYARHLVS